MWRWDHEKGRWSDINGTKSLERGKRKSHLGPVVRGAGISVLKRKNLGTIPPGTRIASRKKKPLSSFGTRRVVSSRGKSYTTGSSSHNFNWNNCLIENRSSVDIARGVCEFGKVIGMEVNGSKGQLVKDLEGMEVGDCLAAGKISEDVESVK